MRIAILGWGSLIWDPCDLPREGTWQEGGPALPVEFSRISSDGRLTPVIDPDHCSPVPTRFVLSPRADLDDAVSDLRTREETGSRKIGFVDLRHGTERCRVGNLLEILRNWTREHGFDGVVWTDLEPNFEEQLKIAFSLDVAEGYLLRLPKTVANRARKYIENAPAEVDTPLRRRLRASGWLEA